MSSHQERGDALAKNASLTADEESELGEVVNAQSNVSLRLEAHPGEKLLAHCLQVGIYARRLISEIPLHLPAGLSKDAFDKLAFLAGACHDFGKATSQFQVYLHTDDWREKERLKADPRTRHALLGAVVAHTILTHSNLDEELRATTMGRILRLAPFWVIRRHHGNLLYPHRDLLLGEDDAKLLAEQLDDCSVAEFDFIVDRIVQVGHLTMRALVTHSQLKAALKTICRDIGCDGQDIAARDLRELRKDHIGSLAPWLLLQQLFSVLLAADKSYAAVEIRRPVNDHGLNADWVTRYRASRFKALDVEGVNAWRAEVASVARQTIQASPVETSFFNLTLPTGLGKTLIALDCALQLRERLQDAAPPNRTIIYALPFLSILEQAAGVYDELFATALGCAERNIPSEIMIRHHHLAELRYVKGEEFESGETEGNREFNPNQSQLMIEGWRSALVMTSTVQLFQSLFAGRNRTTRKLHRLAGAIVVLDEVQSIAFKYWPLLNRTMRALNQLFDTRFILVTATQPRFLNINSTGAKAVELVPSYKTYFDRLDRTVTRVDLTPLSTESFADSVESKLRKEHPQQDALIVVNTIGAAIKLFDRLSSQMGDQYEVIHLSTNIIPDERAKRIAFMRELQRRARPVVVVSTQLVEAGVDLSFPVLFRDFAPFSSIVQAAGRANRGGEYPSRGQVYLFKLIDERGRSLASQIYDSIELNATEEVSKRILATGIAELNEEQLIAGVESYFAEIQPASTQESHEVLCGARALCFKPKSKGEKEALETFRLIEDEDTREAFIEIDERAAKAWHEYDTLYRQPFNPTSSLEESFAHAGKLRAAQIKCRPFILSVPAKYFNDDERAQARKDEICYYAHSEIASVYKRTTGWIRTRQD